MTSFYIPVPTDPRTLFHCQGKKRRRSALYDKYIETVGFAAQGITRPEGNYGISLEVYSSVSYLSTVVDAVVTALVLNNVIAAEDAYDYLSIRKIDPAKADPNRRDKIRVIFDHGAQEYTGALIPNTNNPNNLADACAAQIAA